MAFTCDYNTQFNTKTKNTDLIGVFMVRVTGLEYTKWCFTKLHKVAKTACLSHKMTL